MIQRTRLIAVIVYMLLGIGMKVIRTISKATRTVAMYAPVSGDGDCDVTSDHSQLRDMRIAKKPTTIPTPSIPF